MTDKEIDSAVEHLAQLLRSSDADHTTVQSVLSKLQALALPPQTHEEEGAQHRVQDAHAAQRAVALLRTEARLNLVAAQRGAGVVERLEHAQLAANDRFRASVIEPAAAEVARREELARLLAEKAAEKEHEFILLRRKASCAVSVLLANTERLFDEEFVLALSCIDGRGIRADDAALQVRDICKSIGKQQKKCDRPSVQPVPEGMTATSPDYLGWLCGQAQEMLSSDPPSEFRSLTNYLASEFGGSPCIAPIKGYVRTVQKAQEKYGGDYSRLLDLTRGMVIFDTIPQLAAALSYIKSAHDVTHDDRDAPTDKLKLTLVRAKDRLSPQFDASRFTNGYRDVLLNLRFSTGHVAELQLHIASFLRIKNGKGHVTYEAARSVHMFNPAFTHCKYRWLPDSDDMEVDVMIKDINEGAITSLNLDYSEGLWSENAQSELAKALLDPHCMLRELSLSSCRCGDDFIVKALPVDDRDLWSPSNRPVCSTLRLGSKLHEGTAGRISSIGIGLILKYLNNSLRFLDLEGCLDLDWNENCGDVVAESIRRHVSEYEAKGKSPLPQFQELNLKTTGLTAKGMDILQQLKQDGHLKHTRILHDDELRVGPPRRLDRGASMCLW